MQPSSCAVEIHYDGDDDFALIFVVWMHLWNGCRVFREQIARAFIWHDCCVSLNSNVLLAFDTVWGCNFTHSHVTWHFAFQLNALLRVVVLALNEQYVRLYYCAYMCVCAFCVWCSKRSQFYRHAQFYCSNTHYNDDDDSALLIFFRWMYETGFVLALNKQLVRLHCCVCVHKFEGFIGVWCSMRS